MKVSIPKTNDFQASLITAGQNEILYRVDGVGMTSVSGTVGPFTTGAPDGFYDFSVDIPNGGPRVLSVQLNDVATGDPLAVGATKIDLSLNTPVNGIQVELGSVTRTCYVLNVSGGSSGSTYNFMSDVFTFGLQTGPAYDIQVNYSAGLGNPLTILNAQSPPVASIAYLGNGNLVDHNFVPLSPTAFQTNSALAKGAPLAVGDIFCIKPNSIPGGHAWVQVVQLGNGVMYVGPIFRYRVNSLIPHYEYDRTTADTGSTCGGGW
jgi:hypothetical protein